MSGLGAMPSSIVLPGANRLQPGKQDKSAGPVNGADNTFQRQAVMAEANQQFAGIRSRAMAEDSDTRKHEQAHQCAGGSLAGGVCLCFQTVSVQMPDGTSQSVSYAAEGSVPIAMPGVPPLTSIDPSNRQKLEQARSNLQIARSAALAPSSPSSPDAAIAARASSDLSSVNSLLGKFDSLAADKTNPLNPMAKDLAANDNNAGKAKGQKRLNVMG
jgi:hypothetical protein